MTIQIPIRNNKLYEPNQLEIVVWEAAYPYIDIHAELRKIAAWNHSNLARRKTHSGIARHINSWLSQANDKELAELQNVQESLNNDQWRRQALGI